jgi:hypothetical protein
MKDKKVFSRLLEKKDKKSGISLFLSLIRVETQPVPWAVKGKQLSQKVGRI